MKFRLLNKIDGKFWMNGLGWDLYSLACSYREQIGIPQIFQLIQFTGLLDRNGREIYEGDIVEYSWGTLCSGNSSERRRGVVKMGRYGWYIEGQKTYEKIMPFDNDFRVNKASEREDEKVIGNIYENPELLNSTKSECCESCGAPLTEEDLAYDGGRKKLCRGCN